ncbi:MAG: FAD-dependent oxidoreductase [Chloroflexota bacterium]
MKNSGLEATEVLIIGGGGAGLAAAVAAASRGIATVLLEKCPDLGGSTAYSVGSFCAAGTRLQRRHGIADSAAAFREDMAAADPKLVGRDSPALRTALSVEAGQTLAWLERQGVAFAGPFPEPPNRVPRMHNIIPYARTYIARLRQAARRAGVIMLLGASAEKLLSDEQGRVVGVRYSRGGAKYDLYASRGVILATGDFSGNAELRQRFLQPAAAAATPINPSNTGDGHLLAAELGAAWRNMDVIFGPQLRFPPPGGTLVDRLPSWRWLSTLGAAYVNRVPRQMLGPFVKSVLITHTSPSAKLFAEGAILVNKEGRRFCDERASTAGLAYEEEGKGYIILDQPIATRFTRYPYFISTAPGIAYAYFQDYARARPDVVHRAADAVELAGKLGMAPQALQQALADAGRSYRPPLYALGPVLSMLTVTEGGIAVDAQCRALREDGRPIAGLYAVGGAGQGGMQLLGHGLHIAWAFTSGRLAGENAARSEPVPIDPNVLNTRVGATDGGA